MYELAIEKGEWTYSTMMELISDIREDLNHDKKYDDEDLYGLITSGGSFINAYLWAFDNPIFSTNENTGEPEFVLLKNGNKISRIFTNLIKMHRKTNGVYMGYYTDEMFVDGKAIFYNSTFGSAASSLRNMEAEKWGIIPYPKYNAKQTKYITAVDGGHNAIVIPRTSNERKLEKIGTVTEALNCLSQSVVTEYYDKGLKSKYLGDPREAKAIDLIMSNRVFDFGYIYLEFKSPAFWLQDMIPSGDDEIVAKYGIKRGELENIIEDAFEAFGLSFSGLP